MKTRSCKDTGRRHLSASKTVRNKLLLFKQLRLCHFVWQPWLTKTAIIGLKSEKGWVWIRSRLPWKTSSQRQREWVSGTEDGQRHLCCVEVGEAEDSQITVLSMTFKSKVTKRRSRWYIEQEKRVSSWETTQAAESVEFSFQKRYAKTQPHL